MRDGTASVDARTGLGVLGFGAALLGAAVLFDAEPLYVPGIALVLMALLAGAWVLLGSAGGRVSRSLEVRRVLEDERLIAYVRVRGGPFGLAGAALVDPLLDRPYALRAARREERLRVEARFHRRGRRELAPPELVVGDPLGLFSVRRSGGDEPAHLLVLPRIDGVRAASPGGRDGAGVGRGRAPRGGAEIEMDGLRPMRPGAPASRIHWPALARGAGLLERRLLPEADARPLVVLDPRSPESPAALDAAVRATASLSVHLARHGGCLLLLPGDRRPTPLDATLHGWTALHVRLALLDAEGGPALGALSGRQGPVLLVIARVTDRPPRALLTSNAPARMLIVPGALGGRRAAFTVGGCTGYELGRADAGTEAA